jgi:DNA-directed RNA polymerase I and III subunit RPAC1
MATESLWTSQNDLDYRRVSLFCILLPGFLPLIALKLIGINAETVTRIPSTDFPAHSSSLGEDQSWDKKKFRENFHVKFHHNTPLDSSFSLIGIDASIANAFRRILIAEIPTLAIEYVFVNNNTSIIQDEVLSQRLGLIPFKGGKEGLLDFLKWFKKPAEDSPDDEKFDRSFDYNTIILHLKVECMRNNNAEKNERDPLKLYHNAHVYAEDIKFQPFGRQLQYFSDENAILTTNPDILIAKLRPGQCIDVEMHAIKGVGRDHAKFSPVATASYRLLPTITITKPILGRDAEKFARCFPRGVIGLEHHNGERTAVVKDAMKDTVSRECLRHAEFDGKVKLGRVRDHFIFSVESLGQWDSDEMFLEAVKTLKFKCIALKGNLMNMAR